MLWRLRGLGSITCFNSLPERLYSPLDFFMLPHKPVGGPNPMELPPQVFELLLAEPVPVSGGIAGVIRGTVTFDCQYVPTRFGGMYRGKIDSVV